MTINKEKIIEMTKKILRHQEGLQDRTIMHPVREWFIGLGLGITIFVVVAVSSGFTYWQNKQSHVNFDEVVSETTVYRESQVKDALKQYRARDKERANLTGGIENVNLPEVEATPATATTSPLELATSTATSS